MECQQANHPAHIAAPPLRREPGPPSPPDLSHLLPPVDSLEEDQPCAFHAKNPPEPGYKGMNGWAPIAIPGWSYHTGIVPCCRWREWRIRGQKEYWDHRTAYENDYVENVVYRVCIVGGFFEGYNPEASWPEILGAERMRLQGETRAPLCIGKWVHRTRISGTVQNWDRRQIINGHVLTQEMAFWAEKKPRLERQGGLKPVLWWRDRANDEAFPDPIDYDASDYATGSWMDSDDMDHERQIIRQEQLREEGRPAMASLLGWIPRRLIPRWLEPFFPRWFDFHPLPFKEQKR